MNTDRANNIGLRKALNAWQVMQTQANEFASPSELAASQITGLFTETATTVALVLQQHHKFALSDHPQIDQCAWWPHTHGNPELLSCLLEVESPNQSLKIPCGKVGFRHVKADQSDGSGLEGYHLHLINETDALFKGYLEAVNLSEPIKFKSAK